MLKRGSVIDGKYKILRIIGQGGMSTVYLALNEHLGTLWAIKEILNGTADRGRCAGQRPHSPDAFFAETMPEARILAHLNHPALPEIIDVIHTEHAVLIIMEYIEGMTLARLVQKNGAQSQDRVLMWALQICDVLMYLHTREIPIIYRDLKPSNLILRPDGTLVLIDFGTAEPPGCAGGRSLGTRGYAAPEQYRAGGQIDARTDIYAFGATLFYLLTGRCPDFAGESVPGKEGATAYEDAKALQKTLHREAPAASRRMCRLIGICMQEEAKRRFPDMLSLRQALDAANRRGRIWSLRSRSAAWIRGRSGTAKEKIREGKRRRRYLCSCVMVVLLSMSCILCRTAQIRAVQQGYESALTAAARSTDFQSRETFYETAVLLDPSREEAWLQLLELYVYGMDGYGGDGTDGVQEITLSREESASLIALLGYSGSGTQTNESLFMQNEEGYDCFCFRLGLYYFFYFDAGNSLGKAMSLTWLGIAEGSETLSDADIALSQRLYAIAGYYSSLNTENPAGSDASYAEYWADLCAVTDEDIFALSSVLSVLTIYRELVVRVRENVVDFKRSGITQTQMMEKLSEVRTAILEGMDPWPQRYQEEALALIEEIEEAEEAVNVAFSGQDDTDLQ